MTCLTFEEAKTVGFDAVFFVVVISSLVNGDPNKSVNTLETAGGFGFGGSGFASGFDVSVDSEDLAGLFCTFLLETLSVLL